MMARRLQFTLLAGLLAAVWGPPERPAADTSASGNTATQPKSASTSPSNAPFQLAAIRRGESFVPPIVTRNMPARLADDATPVAERKRLFFKAVLPAVLKVNARIQADRRFVNRMNLRRAVGVTPSPLQRKRLENLAARYRTEPTKLDELRRRVDIIPPSLALAQAAIESGWGRSRFAQGGNALFGQRTYHCQSCGMKPKGYESDPGFRVRSFETVMGAIQAYMQNLNTHPAYAPLRHLRARMRENGEPLHGQELAQGLIKYSERGQAYIKDIRQIIASNDLTDFDAAHLTVGTRIALLQP